MADCTKTEDDTRGFRRMRPEKESMINKRSLQTTRKLHVSVKPYFLTRLVVPFGDVRRSDHNCERTPSGRWTSEAHSPVFHRLLPETKFHMFICSCLRLTPCLWFRRFCQRGGHRFLQVSMADDLPDVKEGSWGQ